MRTTTLTAMLLLGPAFAQEPAADPLASARTRLQKALATMAALPSCAFESSWGPDKDAKAKAGAPAVVFLGGPATTDPGTATGCYADGILHLTSRDHAVAFANRRMIAKTGDGWVVRRGKFADGSALSFVPDPQVLFDLMKDWQLAVTHREVGTLADKPVEILSVTLNDDQVAEAYWSGLLPENVGGIGGVTVLRGGMAMAVGGAKPAAPKTDATVDLAFYLDPATGQVHEVRARSWSDTDKAMAAMGVVGFRAAKVAFGGGDAEEEEEEEEEPKPVAGKAAELQYKDGLPVRPRKKMSVTDYTLKLRDHGTAKPPQLDAAARALLGLR